MAKDTAGERFYYADGERIPLVPSREFVAVRTDEKGARANAEAVVAASAEDPMRAPGQVFDLAEFNLLVVRIPDGASSANGSREPASRAAGAESLRARLSDPGLGTAPPVYEVGVASAGAIQALIPIGEAIVKFKPGVSEAAARKLLRDQHLEVRREDYPEEGAFLVATGQDDAIDVANRLHEDDLVEYAQPNFAHVVSRLSSPEAAGVDLLDLNEPTDEQDIQVFRLFRDEWGVTG